MQPTLEGATPQRRRPAWEQKQRPPASWRATVRSSRQRTLLDTSWLTHSSGRGPSFCCAVLPAPPAGWAEAPAPAPAEVLAAWSPAAGAAPVAWPLPLLVLAALVVGAAVEGPTSGMCLK